MNSNYIFLQKSINSHIYRKTVIVLFYIFIKKTYSVSQI